MNSDVLLNIGFVDVAKWVIDGDSIGYIPDGPGAGAWEVMLDLPNALYAFVQGSEVVYIGKTARSIRKRFTGYCRPGSTQATNQRCHRKIREAIVAGSDVRILVFTPITHLRYAEFEINLAAGLEDSLIREFDPPWNGGGRGQRITEEAEREQAEEQVADEGGRLDTQRSLASFTVPLGKTYYEFGYLNPGAEASRHLGEDGEPLEILFEDGTDPIFSAINRTANRNGSVRAVGNNRQIARWFQQNFRRDETVRGEVLTRNRILLRR